MTARKLLALLALALFPLQQGQAADPERGRLIATRGAATGGLPCAVCHGEKGQGKIGLEAPRLAGLFDHYLLEQLQDFASGERPSEFMVPIARTLTQADMADVAAYYAQQEAPYLPPNSMSEDLRARGAALAMTGSLDDRVQACEDCHGPAGLGKPPLVPPIVGQPAGYMRQTLKAFRSGRRSNDPYRLMRHVASGLSDRDIEALVAYFASVRP